MWESCHRKAGAYSIIWSAIKVHVMYTARNYTRYVNACDGVTAPMCLNQGNRFIHSGIKYGCLIDRCLRACSTAVRTEAAPLPGLPCLRLPGSYVPLLPLLSPFSSFLSSLPLTMILNNVGELATRCLNRELALRLVRVLMDGIFGKDLLGTNRFRYASARLRSSCIHH